MGTIRQNLRNNIFRINGTNVIRIHSTRDPEVKPEAGLEPEILQNNLSLNEWAYSNQSFLKNKLFV